MSRLPKGAAVLGTALVLMLAGCSTPADDGGTSGGGSTSGSGGSDTISVDVGLDSPVEITGPPVLALFASTDYNDFSTFGHKEADRIAADAGITLDYFAGDTPDVQLQQLQNAIQTGKYNGFIVQPKGAQICDALTKDAPEAGILVSVFGNSVCGDDPLNAEEAALPGLLTWVGGTQLRGAWQTLAEHAVEDNPNAKTAVSVGGFPALTFSVAAKNGFAEAFKGTDIKDLGVLDTDYSVADSLSKTQTFLLANPDVSIILTLSDSIAEGVAQAIDEAGLSGISVYDSGCSKAVLALIEAGKVKGCVPTSSVGQYGTATQLLLDAIGGKEVPRFVENDGLDDLPEYVNEDNLSEFTAPF
jgi:ABC-type sugar transport system substrate-binding protein